MDYRRFHGTITEAKEPYELPVELQGLWYLLKVFLAVVVLIILMAG